MKPVSLEQSFLEESLLPRSNKVGVSNFFIKWPMKSILYISSSAATVFLLLPQEMVGGTTVPSLFRDLPNLYQIFLISTVFAFVGAFSSLMNQHKPRVERFFRIIAVASILFALAIVFAFVGAVSNFFTLRLMKLILYDFSSAATVSLLLPQEMVDGRTVPSLFRDLPNLYQIFLISTAFVGAFSSVMKVLSGDDDDLAKRNDIGESWRKNFTPPLAGAGIKSKDDDAGDSEDEYYKQVEQRQTSRISAGSSSPEPVDGNRQITDQLENSGSVQGRDGAATPDIDWDFDPTPHIGRTGGITADGLPFSQASNSVEGQEASSSGNNGGSGAGSGSDESDRSTGSGGTDTDERISRPGAGDEHDEDDRDEGNDRDRLRDRDMESGILSSVRNSSNMTLVATLITIVVQSTPAIIALSLDGASPRARKLFTGALVTNLVGFLCLYVALFLSTSPRAVNILVRVGGAAAAVGFLLMLGVKLSLGIIVPACVVILAASVLSFMPNSLNRVVAKVKKLSVEDRAST